MIFELFRRFFINSEPFCSYFGTPLGLFFGDFCVSYFTVIFSTNFDDNGALTGPAQETTLPTSDESPHLDITDFLHPDDVLLDGSNDRIFDTDVEVINLHQNAARLDISDEANDLINKRTDNADFSFVIEENVSTLITEPEMLLETGQLFADPLDVFDETDFS